MLNQIQTLGIQASMWESFKAYWRGWWVRNICDDFVNHYPDHPEWF